MIGDHPGSDMNAVSRARQIRFKFDTDPDANFQVQDKAGSLVEFLSYWCSERRWRNWGDNPERLRNILEKHHTQLRRAIEQCYE